ncbi:MAG: hypothetical protein AAB322_03510, partial [Pseudomonadota bacterium]
MLVFAGMSKTAENGATDIAPADRISRFGDGAVGGLLLWAVGYPTIAFWLSLVLIAVVLIPSLPLFTAPPIGIALLKEVL